MADCRADDTAGQTRRTAAFGECARGAKRDFLRPVDRLPMEGLAQGPAAEEHGPRLPRTLEVGWHVGAHPSRTVHGGARAGRRGAKPDSSHYRLANSQRLAKRGAWLDPSGYDAGKEIKGPTRRIRGEPRGPLVNL